MLHINETGKPLVIQNLGKPLVIQTLGKPLVIQGSHERSFCEGEIQSGEILHKIAGKLIRQCGLPRLEGTVVEYEYEVQLYKEAIGGRLSHRSKTLNPKPTCNWL
jgi:hypothetical protein